MFSKPMAFVFLALGCLTAAAGGAYMATRQNASEAVSTATAARPSTAATPASTPSATTASATPVAETEAVVSAQAPKPAEALPAEAPAAPSSQPSHAAAPVTAVTAVTAATRTTKPAATPEPSVRHDTASPPATSRTGPTPGTTPAAQNEPIVPPQAAPAAPPAPVPAKPQPEPAKPFEDPPQPEPVHVPQFEELILPASAVIGLQVETPATSERARVEDRIEARVSRDVMAAGRVAIPAGSRVIGSITLVERGGKVKEQARLGIRFHTLVLADGSEVPLHTEQVLRQGDPPAASSSKKIGGAAVAGSILGAILGGGKGAAAGGAIGAGAGTAAVMAGDRSAATLRQGEYLNVKLSSPATITVARHE